MTKPTTLGVTRLQSALDCPLCFWLSNRLGSPPSIFAGITSQMDSVIKNYMNQFVGSSDLPKWFSPKGTFLDASPPLRVTDSATGITLIGKLDALVRDFDGGYHVVDYKTGRPSNGVPNYYQTQLDGYAYLLQQKGCNPVVDGTLLYFTPANGDISAGLFSFDITAVRTEVNPNRVPLILERIKDIIDSPTPPSRSESCEACMWREQASHIYQRGDR